MLFGSEAHAVNTGIHIHIDSHEHWQRVCLALVSSVNQNARANSIKYTRILAFYIFSFVIFSYMCGLLVPVWICVRVCVCFFRECALCFVRSSLSLLIATVLPFVKSVLGIQMPLLLLLLLLPAKILLVIPCRVSLFYLAF